MMSKNKIKSLLPSLREKKRYLVFEIISKANITDFKEIEKNILENTLRFLGELGMAKAGILILKDKFDIKKQKGIIRVSHKYVNELRASLALIQKINNQVVIVRSIGLSGILKKAVNKYIAS